MPGRTRIFLFLLILVLATLPLRADEHATQNEEALRHQLLGKTFYLRSGYLDNSLAFDEHGRLVGHSPQGSYTLCLIEIHHLRLTKHRLELEGSRMALHFTAQLASEDPSTAFDRVTISEKKKPLRLTIDRERLISPKKKKEKQKPAPSAPSTAPPETTPHEPVDTPADAAAQTTTTSPEHAARLLTEALDRILAPSLDDRMLATLPDFWQLYYQAVAAHTDYRPADPGVLRQNQVDRKARLITNFEPDSNEFAQKAGVAGMALYHTIVSPTGEASQVVIARPIGFGLDENAVTAIRKAHFEPATKDGKNVPVLIDLVVNFRIFSGRTNSTTPPPPASTAPDPKPATPTVLPGPYSLHQ